MLPVNQCRHMPHEVFDWYCMFVVYSLPRSSGEVESTIDDTPCAVVCPHDACTTHESCNHRGAYCTFDGWCRHCLDCEFSEDSVDEECPEWCYEACVDHGGCLEGEFCATSAHCHPCAEW